MVLLHQHVKVSSGKAPFPLSLSHASPILFAKGCSEPRTTPTTLWRDPRLESEQKTRRELSLRPWGKLIGHHVGGWKKKKGGRRADEEQRGRS